MKVSYFPGCTLKTKAKDLDKYARECIRRIIALTERLSELEQKYSELDKAVNGTPLFKLP